MNGAEFGELGAASQSVAELQTALVALGKGIGDPTLMKVAVDGVMGPKTAAAANRALTVHLGAGQAPSNLRSGSLSQATISGMTSQITALITTEIARRGFAAPGAAKVPAKKATVARAATPVYAPVATSTALVPAAASPVYRIPAAASGGTGFDSVMMWAAIGVGVVALGGVAYYFITRQKSGRGGGLRAKTGVPGGYAGFGLAGRGRRRGPYKGKPSEFDVTVWDERDRLHIGITKNGDPIDVDWWDDDARGMIEGGLFKPGRAFKQSVLDYAVETGLIQFKGR
jgi:hypothetical protein